MNRDIFYLTQWVLLIAGFYAGLAVVSMLISIVAWYCGWNPPKWFM